MTTAIRLECLHSKGAVCALCSDKDPRWKGWRVGLGLPADLPEPREKVIHRRWSDVDDRLIQISHSMGFPDADIAKILGTTISAVQARRHKLRYAVTA